MRPSAAARATMRITSALPDRSVSPIARVLDAAIPMSTSWVASRVPAKRQAGRGGQCGVSRTNRGPSQNRDRRTDSVAGRFRHEFAYELTNVRSQPGRRKRSSCPARGPIRSCMREVNPEAARPAGAAWHNGCDRPACHTITHRAMVATLKHFGQCASTDAREKRQ